MWQVLKKSSLPSLRLSRTPFNPKLIFLQNPINFKFIFAKSLQGMSFWYPLLSFYWDYADFSLGFCILGIFRKWVGVLSFCGIFSKSLIGLSPICCDCSSVGPLWQFEHVLRQISLCSCILHYLCTLLHVRCLTKCPSDIFVLNWTQVSSNAWLLPILPSNTKNTQYTLKMCGLCLGTNLLSRYNNGRGKEKRLQLILTKDE